jgi:tRNA(fMet)-specific endonuclease VapC
MLSRLWKKTTRHRKSLQENSGSYKIIIDTNIYSALDRGDPRVVSILQSSTTIMLPLCVLGELHYGFILGARADLNKQRLSTFMSLDFVDVLRSTSKTAEIYGELAFVCRKRGRVLSNNDLWIASLAIEYDVPLVTYDKDFSALSSRLGDNLILLDTN